MRYDDQSHLDDFRKYGVYPKIHDAIASLVLANTTSTRFIEFGSSIGLLADRIWRKVPGAAVWGVEPNADSLSRAQASGVGVGVTWLNMGVNEDTLPALLDTIRFNAIRALVARRVLSEIFALNTVEWARLFGCKLADAGITEIFLQGRAESSVATHPYPSTDSEIMPLLRRFSLVACEGARHTPVAYLRAF